MGKSTTIATTSNLDQQVGFADNSQGDGQRINPTTTGNNNKANIQTGNNNANFDLGNVQNVGTGSVNFSLTDFGAVSAGMDVATAALEMGKDSVKTALTTGAGFVSDAFKYNSDALKNSLDFANTQASKTIDQIGTLTKANQAANAATVDKVLALTENVKTEGASQQNKLVAYIAGGLLLSAVLIVAAIQWGKK